MLAQAAAAICILTGSSSDEGGLIIPEIVEPRLPPKAASAGAFAPPGWRVERTLEGDLNKDGRLDLVAVLKGDDPKCRITTELTPDPMDTNPRLLLVAFAEPGGYALAVANAAVIPRREDPYVDDPLEIGDISIRGGVLRLKLGHWRSAGGWGTYSNTFAFRWDGKAFPMIGFDRDHLQRNSGETEKISVNFLTGKAKIVTGSMKEGVREIVRWTDLPRQTVPNLETIGDGLSYEPKL
jgi:hypothetical protein